MNRRQPDPGGGAVAWSPIAANCLAKRAAWLLAAAALVPRAMASEANATGILNMADTLRVDMLLTHGAIGSSVGQGTFCCSRIGLLQAPGSTKPCKGRTHL